MTISTDISSQTFPGNGVTVSFPCGFRIFDDTDVAVSLIDPVAGTSTLLVLNTDYTIAGAGDQSGFTLMTTNVVASGINLLVSRDIAIEQPTDFTNQGSFFPTMHEDMADRLCMQIQQIAHIQGLTLTLPDGLSPSPSSKLPFALPGSLLGWSEDGSAIVNLGPSGLGAGSIFDANVSSSAGINALKLAFTQVGSGAITRAVQLKLQEAKSVADRGGKGDGTTNNLSALNAAFAYASTSGNQDVYLEEGQHYTSALPTNPVGARFTGPGSVITPDTLIPGYNKQINSYTDMGYAMNREHLYRAYSKLFLGPSGASGVLNVITYGDSTVANYVASGFLDGQYWTENLVPELFASRGLNAVCTNKAVAGTSWSDLPAISDVGSSVDLMIIKYGINDAVQPLSTRLQTMATNMRSKLSAIRSTAGGTPATLSIIVMGPNATIDPANGRDEIWYEQVRNLYIDVCNQYGCAYFDTYAWLKDLRQGAGGNWMDIVSNVSIHPLDIGKIWQYGGMIDAFFPHGHIERYRSNRFVSTGVNIAAATYSQAPGGYNYGQTLQTAQHASGFPTDGAVLTIRSVDGYAIQFNYNFAQGSGNMPLVYTRTGTGGSWSPWSGQAVALTMSNSWVGLSGYSAPRAWRTNDGLVKVTGVVTAGTTTNGTVIATLPAGMRPDAKMVFRAANSGASANTNLTVGTDGTITILLGGDATYTSLDGISFYAAP